MTTRPSKEKQLDQTVEDSFPASDPSSSTGITGPASGRSPRSRTREPDAIPTGLPTSDRYAAETAHHKEQHATTTEDPDKP
jgi:hypothetical protein